MKKGFTLIELLAVIAILSIVLIIAVPKIIDVISNTRHNAFLRNEDMLIKSTKTYLTANQDLIPTNIGDTTEVLLSTLKSNNYISDIKDPYDNSTCTGYILVTKMTDEIYDYTPHLNCESNINSISEDGLVAHYKFNQIDEGTTNLWINNLLTYNNLSIPSSLIATGEIYAGAPVYRLTMTPTTAAQVTSIINNLWNHGVYGSSITYLANTKYTSSIYWKAINRSDVIVNGLASNIGGWSSEPNEILGNGWNRTISKRDGLVTEDRTGHVFWSFRSPSFVLGDTIIIDWAAPQIEQKDHPTKYTSSTRNTTIKDYSNSSNDAIVNGAILVNDRFNKSNEAISFDGIDDYLSIIDNATIKLNDNFSVSAWVYLRNQNSVGIIHKGDSSLTGAGLAYGWGGNGFMFISWNGSNQPYKTQNIADINSWHNIVGVVNNNVRYLYVDGNYIGSSAAAVSSWNNNRNLIIGGSGNVTNFMNGYIDDVQIYNRVLSANEIKRNYETKK